MQINDKVYWESTSNGSTTTKNGVICAFIAANEVPSQLYPELNGISSSQDKLGYGKHGTSTNDRVLVRVDRTGMTGKELKSQYYAPRSTLVKLKK